MQFVEALIWRLTTIEHRETTHILNDTLERIKTIESSEILKDRWTRYSKNYPYAEDITYEDTVDALKKLIGLEG